MTTKNDIAWEKYITETNIKLDGRRHIVKAKELKEIAEREPRLLAKFDNPEQTPKILRNAGYSLLAITNGSYLIFKGNTFATISDCSKKEVFQPKTDFKLYTTGRGSGESEYIDNAFNTGLISEFIQSGKLYLTIRGRERTGRFDFRIESNNTEIEVDGVQIEVDAGFEGNKDIVLVEGKIGSRNQFNIRQLYYPYRHFSQLIPNKNIRTVFFSYDLSKATYALHEFGFKDTKIFDSIYQIHCCVYSFSGQKKYIIQDLTDKSFGTDNNIVPQADDLNKILEILSLINNGQNTVADIADYFVFDERQSNYYGEAAEFLGLITRKQGVFELTDRGRIFISTTPSEQQIFIAKLVINSWFFRELIKMSKRKGFTTRADIEELIASVRKDNDKKRYTNSTIERRVITIAAWIKWLSEEFQCFEIDENKFTLK